MSMRPNTVRSLNCERAVIWLIAGLLLLPAAPVGSQAQEAPRFFAVHTTYDYALDDIARRFSLVIWHGHPRSVEHLPWLRRKNPQLKALLYREMFCVLSQETPLAESVGHYEEILADHPDWFQRDASDRIVEVPDYPGRFMMDAGNPEWQDFWIRETLREVKAGGWDGVFADDALTSVRMHDLPPLRNYPDDASLQDAFFGFLQRMHEAFQKEGKLVIANVSNSYDHPGLFEKWLGVTDGIMEEHFSGKAWSWGPRVGEQQLQAMQTARRAGKWYLALTYGGWEEASLRDLSLASYLVASGGHVAWAYRPAREYPERFPVDPPWLGKLGVPKGEPWRQGAVWGREFHGGVLLVNPSGESQQVDHRGERITIAPHGFVKR